MAALLLTWLCVQSARAETQTLDLVTFEYHPTMHTEGTEIKGCAVDIVREALARIGCRADIRMVPYARGLLMVEHGVVDGMFTVYRRPEREAFAHYPTRPVMWRVVSFYVLAESPITFAGDLNAVTNRSIGTVRGYSYGMELDGLLASGAFCRVDPATDPATALKKLLRGRFELMPHTEHDMGHLQKHVGAEGRILKLSPPIETVPTYLIFSRKRPGLARLAGEFDRAMAGMEKDGTYERLMGERVNDAGAHSR
ncbi:MAG: transporter substrate-binding domain-containing protein [Kiritimatiellae bacterium]|nr:transporter substrate-binding domain-containing protein [Kiritimatiellia bacterium]